jgi:hypothetical protein
MARKRYCFTEARIQRFIREGRGRGTGKNYKPWLTVSDVPSLGRVHRVYCTKTDREHHLLSDNEYYAFLLQWWTADVIDIREQYPLIDRRETLEIAARCGVRHPMDPNSGALLVMTTDFLITVGGSFVAYAVKDVKELADERSLEKLEIERRYWERREVPWRLLTDQQVKNTFTQNLSWVLNSGAVFSDAEKFPDRDRALQQALIVEIGARPHTPVRLLCRGVDEKLSCRAGTALATLRRLIASKLIKVDLHARNLQDLPAQSFRFVEVRSAKF